MLNNGQGHQYSDYMDIKNLSHEYLWTYCRYLHIAAKGVTMKGLCI